MHEMDAHPNKALFSKRKHFPKLLASCLKNNYDDDDDDGGDGDDDDDDDDDDNLQRQCITWRGKKT